MKEQEKNPLFLAAQKKLLNKQIEKSTHDAHTRFDEGQDLVEFIDAQNNLEVHPVDAEYVNNFFKFKNKINKKDRN